jgi:hypothetical protein
MPQKAEKSGSKQKGACNMRKLNKMAVVLGVMGMCVCVTLAEEPVSPVVATKQASTWSDMTALFRPSRWAHPIAAGGTLSWLNYNAWADEPGRTTKVLAGEVIVLGSTYFLLEAFGVIGGGGGGGGATIGGGEMPF